MGELGWGAFYCCLQPEVVLQHCMELEVDWMLLCNIWSLQMLQIVAIYFICVCDHKNTLLARCLLFSPGLPEEASSKHHLTAVQKSSEVSVYWKKEASLILIQLGSPDVNIKLQLTSR